MQHLTKSQNKIVIVITDIVLKNGVKLLNMQLALAVSNYATCTVVKAPYVA